MPDPDWIDRFADRLADDRLVGALTGALAPLPTGGWTSPGALAVALLELLPPDAAPVRPAREQLARALRDRGVDAPALAQPPWGALFEYAADAIHRLGYSHISAGVLLACLAGFPGFTVPTDRLLRELLDRGGVAPLPPSRSAPDGDYRYASLGYGIDLTRKVAGLADCPVVGRDQEIEQLTEVLIGGQSPILTGEAGVGKTALVEGFAWRLARPTNRALTDVLRCRTVLVVQVGDLIAGTGVQGALEKRIQEFVAHLAAAGDVVPFIDEAHALLAGGPAHKVIVEELKPALADGRIRVIGATTDREYQRHFYADPALRRRFSDVRVREPSPVQAEAILTRLGDRALPPGLRGRGLLADEKLAQDAARAAVRVAVDHFKDERLPARPLKLLQRAAAARLLKHTNGGEPPSITPDDVYTAAARELGVDPGVLRGGATAQLARLARALERQLIGQRAAVVAILRGLCLACSGLLDSRRPRGVLLFVGPPGVGKSVACRAIAEGICGSEDAVVELRMRDYEDEQGVSKFRGSGPGYRDSGDTWTVYSQVRSRPSQVVVLEGLEQLPPGMHGPVADVLSGRGADGMGYPTDFGRCVFVVVPGPRLTAELKAGGSRRDAALVRALGAGAAALVRAVVPFGPLSDDALTQIARRELERKAADAPPGTGSAADLLVDQAHDPAAWAVAAAVERGGTGRAVVDALDAAVEDQLFRRVASDLGVTPSEVENPRADH